MVHVTCDLCGKDLRQGEDQRYVVKIEVYAATDPCQITEEDLDEDHLEEVSEILRDEIDVADPSEDPAYKNLRYDLCMDCQRKFLRDPFNRETDHSFDFSEN